MSFGSFVLLPNITGSFGGGWQGCVVAIINTSGAFYTKDTTRIQGHFQKREQSTNPYDSYFDASRSNSIFNKSQTIQPLSLVLNHVIKYNEVGCTVSERLYIELDK